MFEQKVSNLHFRLKCSTQALRHHIMHEKYKLVHGPSSTTCVIISINSNSSSYYVKCNNGGTANFDGKTSNKCVATATTSHARKIENKVAFNTTTTTTTTATTQQQQQQQHWWWEQWRNSSINFPHNLAIAS